MSHTKLPWKVFDDLGDVEIRSASNLNFVVADMRFAPGQSADGKWATEDGNATFICKAANSHYELIAALEEAIFELQSYAVDDSFEGYNNPRFNEILKRAKS